jgi:hypothetical protein
MAFQHGIFYGNFFWVAQVPEGCHTAEIENICGSMGCFRHFFLDVTIGSFSIAMESGPFVDDLLIEHLNLPEFF